MLIILGITISIVLIILLGFLLHVIILYHPKVKKKIDKFFNKLIRYFLNWRFLVCFMIGWMITNGWCYLFIIFGSIFHWTWIRRIGLAYAAFLWVPGTPEKIVTFAIAVGLRKIFFPHDLKLAKMMEEEKEEALND